MKEIKFSVSMCVYAGDNAKYFEEALESVFHQTRKPDELVLVVDGPIPSSINEVINFFSSKHDEMHVFRLKENQGHGNARRLGVSKCQYDYIAIADADDINMPKRFEIQLAYFERNPSLGAVSSGCVHFTDDVKNPINEEKMPESDEEIKKAMKTGCPICQPSVVLNRKVVEDAGGYMDWYMAEDYYLWIRMMQSGATFANTPMSLLYLRTTPDQMARRGGIKYFLSMKRLYDYMLKNKIIGFMTYCFNVSSRFVVQVLMPGKFRAFVRKIIQ